MLLTQILNILNDDDTEKRYGYDRFTFRVRKYNNCYTITYGAMYEPPAGNLSLSKLIKLSELVGTTNIDVDNFAESGCKSCDWGSSYGHDIQIYNATKNIEGLDQLVKLSEEESEVKNLIALVELEMEKV